MSTTLMKLASTNVMSPASPAEVAEASAVATASLQGAMSATDKFKLDSLGVQEIGKPFTFIFFQGTYDSLGIANIVIGDAVPNPILPATQVIILACSTTPGLGYPIAPLAPIAPNTATAVVSSVGAADAGNPALIIVFYS